MIKPVHVYAGEFVQCLLKWDLEADICFVKECRSEFRQHRAAATFHLWLHPVATENSTHQQDLRCVSGNATLFRQFDQDILINTSCVILIDTCFLSNVGHPLS